MGDGSGRTLAAMIVVADLHVGYAARMAAEIVEDGGKAIAMDVSKPDSIAAPVKATMGTYGSPVDDSRSERRPAWPSCLAPNASAVCGHRATAGLVVPKAPSRAFATTARRAGVYPGRPVMSWIAFDTSKCRASPPRVTRSIGPSG
jgi:hypothetical protein